MRNFLNEVVLWMNGVNVYGKFNILGTTVFIASKINGLENYRPYAIHGASIITKWKAQDKRPPALQENAIHGRSASGVVLKNGTITDGMMDGLRRLRISGAIGGIEAKELREKA